MGKASSETIKTAPATTGATTSSLNPSVASSMTSSPRFSRIIGTETPRDAQLSPYESSNEDERIILNGEQESNFFQVVEFHERKLNENMVGLMKASKIVESTVDSKQKKQVILDSCIQLASKYKVVKAILKSAEILNYWTAGKKKRLVPPTNEMMKAATQLLSSLKEIAIDAQTLQKFLPALSTLKLSIGMLTDFLNGSLRTLENQFQQISASAFSSQLPSGINSFAATPQGGTVKQKLPASLHEAAQNKDMQGAYTLVKVQGLGINGVDSDGCTALHYAARNDHVEFMRWLTSENANIHAKDKKGLTAFDKAALAGSVNAAQFLISKGFVFDPAEAEKTIQDSPFTPETWQELGVDLPQTKIKSRSSSLTENRLSVGKRGSFFDVLERQPQLPSSGSHSTFSGSSHDTLHSDSNSLKSSGDSELPVKARAPLPLNRSASELLNGDRPKHDAYKKNNSTSQINGTAPPMQANPSRQRLPISKTNSRSSERDLPLSLESLLLSPKAPQALIPPSIVPTLLKMNEQFITFSTQVFEKAPNFSALTAATQTTNQLLNQLTDFSRGHADDLRLLKESFSSFSQLISSSSQTDFSQRELIKLFIDFLNHYQSFAKNFQSSTKSDAFKPAIVQFVTNFKMCVQDTASESLSKMNSNLVTLALFLATVDVNSFALYHQLVSEFTNLFKHCEQVIHYNLGLNQKTLTNIVQVMTDTIRKSVLLCAKFESPPFDQELTIINYSEFHNQTISEINKSLDSPANQRLPTEVIATVTNLVSDVSKFYQATTLPQLLTWGHSTSQRLVEFSSFLQKRNDPSHALLLDFLNAFAVQFDLTLFRTLIQRLNQPNSNVLSGSLSDNLRILYLCMLLSIFSILLR